MKRLIILSALSFALVSPVAAQDIQGSQRDAEQMMAEFARCEVSTPANRALALAFTREVAGTPSRYPQHLIKGKCLKSPGTKLKLQPALFRVALFPALYSRQFGKAPAGDFAAIAPLDYAREFDGPPAEDTLALRRFGDCVARANPAGARTFLLTKLYSKAEAAAVQAIQPVLGNCLAAGQQFHFSRSILRGAVGEAMYKLSVAADAKRAN